MNADALSRNQQEYYQKGIAALEKNNYEYAIELLMEVVQEAPEYADARRALRQAERLLLQDSPHSVIMMIVLKLNSLLPLIMALIYEALRNTKKALAFYEEALKHFPDDSSLLSKIVSLSIKQNWPQVAIVGYEDILEVVPGNVEHLKSVGYLYKQIGNIEKAKHYFNRALDISPHLQEIKKDLKDMDALSSIRDGNWDDNQSYRTKISDTSKELEQEQIEQKKETSLDEHTQRIAELKKALAESPKDENTRFQLAMELKQTSQFDAARTELKTLIDAAPFNTKFQDAFLDITEHLYTDKIAKLRAQLATDPNNTTLTADIDALVSARRNDMITLIEKKVELYPNDLALRFDYGTLLYESGNHTDAISQFQLSVKDPSRITQSLNKLGLCFAEKGMHDLAAVQFQKALERETGMTDVTKDIIYNLGITFDAMGKKDEALAQYKKIYEIDISYRDIAQKIEEHYS